MPGAIRLLAFSTITLFYFAAGKAGLSLAVVNESTTAVWPPAGIAVAVLLLIGQRAWPAIAAGAFLVNVTTSGSVPASLAIAAGNTCEAVVAAWLVVRFARGPAAFQRTADVLRFTAFAAAGATMIAATVGTAALVANGLAAIGDAASIWMTWWLGDAVGTVVVAPLLVLWCRPQHSSWSMVRLLEAGAVGIAVVVSSTVVFGGWPIGAALPIQFLTVPVLLWAAFRFGARETVTAVTLLSVFAIRGTLDGFGPFAVGSPNTSLLLLQGFIGVNTIVMLAVTAEVSTRRRVESDMRALNVALEARVAERTDELTRLHDRLLEAQEVAHVGSWEWDVGSNELWWSEELYRIYGVGDATPMTYEAFLALVHPDDRPSIDGGVRRALADGESFTFDHRIVRPDGIVRVLHAHGRVIAGPDGRTLRMVGTGHDITELKVAEEQRADLRSAQAARREAEQASRAKDQFLATLSHELRTPLNVALGWAHLLRVPSPGPQQTARAIDVIDRNLHILTQLVADIVDVSRITAGALRLDTGPVDVAAVTEGAVETVRDDAATRGITIETRLPRPAPPLIGDDRRLQQVVWNLLSNAVKFTREGGHVTVSVTCDTEAVQITVEDDGPGIEPAFLPHVFEEFRQADPSVTRTHGGLGLGLSIARHLVNLHGGSITAANRDSGGAILTVRLPVDATGV